MSKSLLHRGPDQSGFYLDKNIALCRIDVKYSKLDTEIHGVPIVREPDGLAISSRNNLLNPDQRLVASELSLILKNTAQQIHTRNLEYLKVEAIKKLEELDFDVDYFSFCNSNTLEEIDEFEPNTLLAVAVNLGGGRLIDNFLIK
mgnify:CR=1 FL=1